MKRQVINQCIAVFTASLTIFLSGLWMGWASAVWPALGTSDLSKRNELTDKSWVASTLDLGNLFTPIPISYINDVYGRRATLICSAAFFLMASFVAIFPLSPFPLCFARLFAGFGKGIGFTVVPIYTAEVVEPRIRGTLGSLLVILMAAGGVYSMSIGPYISSTILAETSIILPVLLCGFYIFSFESPHFQLMRKKEALATKTFEQLRNCEGDKELSCQTEFKAMKTDIERAMLHQKDGFVKMVKDNKRSVIIVLVTGVCQRFSGVSSIVAYAPSSLPPRQGFLDPSNTMIFFCLASVVCAIISAPLIDKVGRRTMMTISNIGLSIVTLVVSIFYYFHFKTTVDVTSTMFIPYVGIILYGAVYSLGMGIVPLLFIGELFPINARSQMAAMAVVVMSLASFIINRLYLIICDLYGLHTVYLLFVTSNMINAMFTYYFVPETKQKTLIEIQEELHK